MSTHEFMTRQLVADRQHTLLEQANTYRVVSRPSGAGRATRVAHLLAGSLRSTLRRRPRLVPAKEYAMTASK
jgi:hypothetical protein